MKQAMGEATAAAKAALRRMAHPGLPLRKVGLLRMTAHLIDRLPFVFRLLQGISGRLRRPSQLYSLITIRQNERLLGDTALSRILKELP